MPAEDTPAKSGPSVAGAIIVFAFVTIVFDNFALSLIFGLLAAGATAARRNNRWQ